MNRLMTTAFRQPSSMAYMFSTKKKQMELTIRTPYRIFYNKKTPMLMHSPDSAE